MTDDAESAGDETDDAGAVTESDRPPVAEPVPSEEQGDDAGDGDDASDGDGTGHGDDTGDGDDAGDGDDTIHSDATGHGDDTGDAEPDAAEEASDPSATAGIDPDSIDPSELTVPERSLNPRIRVVWVVQAVVLAGLAGVVAWAAETFGPLDVGLVLPVGVATGFLVLGVAHALLRYRVWRYEVREDALYLERGVVTRVRTVVPFVRIQHVDTSRGPIERGVGIATSVVYTAGSHGADVTIPGLEADRAEDLQRRLKRLAIASEGDTAV